MFLLNPRRLLHSRSSPSVVRPTTLALHFQNGALRNTNGLHVTVRGVSLFWSQWAPAFYNQRLVEWLADDWHIDVLRIPIAATAPGYLSDPALEIRKAITVTDAAIRKNLYVVVDWHGHDLHTDEAVEFFGSLARHYGDSPNILYETWNEPGRGYHWNTIKRHHESVITEIRRFAPSSVALCGIPDFCTNIEEAIKSPLSFDNIGYTFHFYTASHRQGLRAKLEQALDENFPVFVSEWGPSEANGDGVLDFQEADRWLHLLAKRSVSHIAWAVHDKDEAAALLSPGATSEGGWKKRELSASGAWIRSYLRRPL